MSDRFDPSQLFPDSQERSLAAFDLAWKLAGEAALDAADCLQAWFASTVGGVAPLEAMGVQIDNAALLLERVRAREMAARRFVERVLGALS